MKIGINFTHYIPGRVGGVGVYMKSLLQHLPQTDPKLKIYVVGYHHIQQIIPKIEQVKLIPIPDELKDSTPDQLSALLKMLIDTLNLDFWYSPLLILDPLDCSIPSASYIPDMQHEYFPQYFDEGTLAWRKKHFQLTADNASAIITASKDAKSDLIRLLNLDPQKVHITPFAASAIFSKKYSNKLKNEVLKKYQLKDCKYLIYPANTWPHKNHTRLLEAFAQIKDTHPTINLVLTGYSYDQYVTIYENIKQNKLEGRVITLDYVKDEYMPILYSNAIGMIFPSLFEGFGIPLVEAMSSGCPVLCSNATSIPEVAGKAALYFDPLSVTDIEEKIDMFLSDVKLRRELIHKGLTQAKKFDYKRTAKETMAVIKNEIRLHKAKNQQKIYNWPKISIITPSYNQGKYIERTILSVLNQGYPNLEYLIIDGGSTDNTLDILKSYSTRIKFISEKDKGQSNAINKGIKMSTGEIIAYLNSDDTYQEGTLKKVAKYFHINQEAILIYGRARHIDENDHYLEDYPTLRSDYDSLHGPCGICQPSVFWRRQLTEEIGLFDESLHFGMDYDYWVRASKIYKLDFIQSYLGNTRLYPETKTLGSKVKVHREIIKIQQKHYLSVNSHWIFALVHVELNGLKRDSVLKNTYYISYLILKSFYYQIRYNHSFPPKAILKMYIAWTKEIFSYTYRKIKEMNRKVHK